MKDVVAEPKGNTFIVVWDCEGLEACVDITDKLVQCEDFERESIFERIKHPEVEPRNESLRSITKMIHVMQLRARYNPQRNYEIYKVNTTEGITESDLKNMFEETPQAAADLIRENGDKLYSDRRANERKIL